MTRDRTNSFLENSSEKDPVQIRRDWAIVNLKVNAPTWQIEEAYLRLVDAGEIVPGEPV